MSHLVTTLLQNVNHHGRNALLKRTNLENEGFAAHEQQDSVASIVSVQGMAALQEWGRCLVVISEEFRSYTRRLLLAAEWLGVSAFHMSKDSDSKSMSVQLLDYVWFALAHTPTKSM